MPTFKVGERICHPDYGEGIVTFVGKDYVGVELDGGRDALLRMDSFSPAAPDKIPEPAPAAETTPLPWPESTFVFEKPGTPHYMGSHWDPFFGSAEEVLTRLQEILDQAQLHAAYDKRHEPVRNEPANWKKGVHLVWPEQHQGLVVTCQIRDEEKALVVSTLYPFLLDGARFSLRIEQVMVWESGVEAQISAALGEASITFFDSAFLANRLWYETGRQYDFILTGIAYDAEPARDMELPCTPNPDQIGWQRSLAEKRGEPPPEIADKISLAGAAMFLPVQGWDEDDYSFRGPVKSVREVKDMLGQDGWLVRATVLRLSEYRTEDVDLDILITRKAWQGKEPPAPGQDIEGRLWLQGYLWYPHNHGSIGR